MTNRLKPLALLLAAITIPASVASSRDPSALVVHEWGTFTSIAGLEGEAIDWWTLGGVEDLPCFVERFRSAPKSAVVGTVRMETPVLYFYTPRETTVDVSVKFRQGLVTEWYPRAAVSPTLVPAGLAAGFTHSLRWANVTVAPRAANDFPREAPASHYYAARDTDADPVAVGAQKEKFLFYRGVGRVPVPIVARVDADGRTTIEPSGPDPVSAIVRFERRGGRIGYRIVGALTGAATLEAPVMDGSVATLATELEQVLIGQGLYPREAKAMVETWRDSWFEDGSRIFYIVPARLIDEILPLTIQPRPAGVTRVFVGRVELITAATLAEVADALSRNAPDAAGKYGRFLPAIVDRLYPAGSRPEERRVANRALGGVYASLARPPACPAR